MQFGKYGKLVMTREINNAVADDVTFSKEVLNSIRKHLNCDWGDLCDEDKNLNNNAIKNKNDRILSAYNTSKGRIYIITEYDRSYTTVLFSSEY